MAKVLFRLLALALAFSLGTAAAADAGPQRRDFNIAAQPMAKALNEFATQADIRIVFYPQAVQGLVAPQLAGAYTPRDALKALLVNSALKYRFTDSRTVTISAPGTEQKTTGVISDQMHLAMTVGPETATMADAGPEKMEEKPQDTTDSKGIPEMLVKGNRTSNIDIQRTEDDVQPYVVFTSDDIKRSTAGSLDQFLMSRLPMVASPYAADVVAPSPYLPQNGNKSSIDLRGIGANQTLILVNGRRVPGVGTTSDLSQPDINGIPMSSVARIEVLPSTAGGIYGGGATGGVINIILKDDYSGIEVNGRYDGTFRNDAAQRVLEANAGFSLENGRTNVILSASQRGSTPLYNADRDFAAHARAILLHNNPAVYAGSTLPLGNTSNIRSVNGSPLVLAAGNRPLGSAFTSIPYGYAGPASDNGAALLANAGKYNLDLADNDLVTRRALTGELEDNSLRLNVRRSFTDHIEAFLDATRSTNDSTVDSGAPTYYFSGIPANTPNNPFTTPINVYFPASDYPDDHVVTKSSTLNATVGLTLRLPHDWMVQGEFGMGESENSYSRNQITSYGVLEPLANTGVLKVLVDSLAYPQVYASYLQGVDATTYQPDPLGANMTNMVLRVAGPVFRLPGGPVRLSALLERRKDEVDSSIAGSLDPAYVWHYTYSAPRKQTTEGAYAELTAPLISAANALPLVRALDLQVSYRRDRIGSRTITNTTFNGFVLNSPDDPVPVPDYFTNYVNANQYTVGLRYQPLESLALRASNSVGVLPPSLSQLVPLIRANINPGNTVLDRSRNDTPVGVVAEVHSSGYPELQPEQSNSWSAGAIFTPAFLPGFRVSVDYTLIEKTDEIGSITAQSLLDNESIYPERVRRAALTDADRLAGYEVGRVNYLSYGNTNIAHTKVEAYDFRADYQWNTRYGTFAANAIASHQIHLQKQALATSPVIEYMGFFDGPLAWRGNAGLTWERGAWALGWNTQYFDSFPVYYTNSTVASKAASILNQGSDSIPHQIYHDLSFKYRMEEAPLWHSVFADSEFLMGISNVFDTEPPLMVFFNTGVAAAAPTRYADPRLRRYSISWRKSFH